MSVVHLGHVGHVYVVHVYMLLEAQEKSVGHVGANLAQEKDFSVTLTQEDFTKNLKSLPTSPKLRGGREDPLPLDDTKMRQCKLGELRGVAVVSRPDICARLARTAPKIDAYCGSDVYRIKDRCVLWEWFES